MNIECDYFRYIKKIPLSKEYIVCDINIDTVLTIKTRDYYEAIAFRTLICELIYQGVHMFPDIIEYTIKLDHLNVCSYIKLGFFEELDENGDPCMVKIITAFKICYLSRKQIHALYTANRVMQPDFNTINNIMYILLLYETMPIITTDFVLNKKMINVFFKKPVF